jgi:hypothetical protein
MPVIMLRQLLWIGQHSDQLIMKRSLPVSAAWMYTRGVKAGGTPSPLMLLY